MCDHGKYNQNWIFAEELLKFFRTDARDLAWKQTQKNKPEIMAPVLSGWEQKRNVAKIGRPGAPSTDQSNRAHLSRRCSLDRTIAPGQAAHASEWLWTNDLGHRAELNARWGFESLSHLEVSDKMHGNWPDNRRRPICHLLNRRHDSFGNCGSQLVWSFQHENYRSPEPSNPPDERCSWPATCLWNRRQSKRWS